jgi:hypothetical protein
MNDAEKDLHVTSLLILSILRHLSEEDALAKLEPARTLVRSLGVAVCFAAAKWHLEAWFFADSQSLRAFLGRDLGAVDASRPDGISDPKRHLIRLLDGIYSTQVAGEIAASLQPREVRRSPSFCRFEAAMRNGDPSRPSSE